MKNCVEVVMVVIYISPNQKLEDKEFFIYQNFLEYCEEVS